MVLQNTDGDFFFCDKNGFILQCFLDGFNLYFSFHIPITDSNAKTEKTGFETLSIFPGGSVASLWLSNTSEHKLPSTCLRSLFSYPLFKADDRAQLSPTHCVDDRNSTLQLLNLGDRKSVV